MTGQKPISQQIILLYQCEIPTLACQNMLFSGLAKIPEHLHGDILRFKRLEDRLTRFVARRLVSIALEESGFVLEAGLENWQTDSWGRPYIAGSVVDFSISHSESRVVVALTQNGRVGVDLEHFRTIDIDSLKPLLSNREFARLQRGDNPQVEAVRCWCLREAILKADGRGLLAPEQFIRDILSTEISQGGSWRVVDFADNQAALFIATDQLSAQISHKYLDFQDVL
jgi:4'-phosphopantetheinyl transferase